LKGQIFENYQERDVNIKDAYYSGMLDNKLKSVVWSKHQGQLS
jgi:hypothetical protein